MIVKPTISFLSTDSDSSLSTNTRAILAAMEGNPNYPSPNPALPVVRAAGDAFADALVAAADGGKTLTASKNARRAELVLLLRQLANYVAVACQGDLTVLMTAGFPIHKPQRQPIGVLTAPGDLTVTFGARMGELDAATAPVPGAAIYNWRLSTAAAPNVVVQTAQTTAASNTFTGLAPGVVYRIEANAVGTAGPSNWSNPVSRMAV